MNRRKWKIKIKKVCTIYKAKFKNKVPRIKQKLRTIIKINKFKKIIIKTI